jgi:hypothetical protein
VSVLGVALAVLAAAGAALAGVVRWESHWIEEAADDDL